MIGGGHFIIQSAISQGKRVRNFGFGTFELKGGIVVETGMVGSWEGFSGWAAEVKFEMVDENHMEKTFNFDGREVKQTYVRM